MNCATCDIELPDGVTGTFCRECRRHEEWKAIVAARDNIIIARDRRIAELEAQVGRLRAALRDLSIHHGGMTICGADESECEQMRGARAVLKETP